MSSTDSMSVIRDAVASAINRVRDQPNVVMRPGTVVRVSSNQQLAEIRPDEILGVDESFGGDDVQITQALGAQIISPVGIRAGDRVMILFIVPHGAYVIGKLAGDYEPWRTVGSGNNPPFAANWGHAAGTVPQGFAGPAFVSFRRIGRWVEIRGQASRSADVAGLLPIFTLPSDYRPSNDLTIKQAATAPFALTVATLFVRRSGVVEILTNTGTIGGGGGYVSLDGTLFSTDEVGQVI